MLEEQINGFIEYCKVSGFRDKSIESLSIRLNQFKKFLITARLRKIKSITYRHLSRFVADYKNPSIHVKKARIWSLRQFFHYLKLNGYVNENIATDLPYPKIEKTVPHFLTIREYNLILHHFSGTPLTNLTYIFLPEKEFLQLQKETPPDDRPLQSVKSPILRLVPLQVEILPQRLFDVGFLFSTH